MGHYECRGCNQRYEDCDCMPVNAYTGKRNYFEKEKVKEDYPEDHQKKHLYVDSAEMELRERVNNHQVALDLINAPPHYTNPDGFPQVIEILMRWFPKEPLLWQVGKYIARWDRKDTPLENLKKARYYLNVKIKELDPKDRGY